jgi:hypothetical protein
VFNLQLNGILAWLENTYISKKHVKAIKEQPVGKTGSFILNQNLSQSQNISVQISIKEFEKVIDDNRKKYADDSKEVKFLDKVKAGLRKVNDIKDVILLIFNVAKSVGLSFDDIKRIIG